MNTPVAGPPSAGSPSAGSPDIGAGALRFGVVDLETTGLRLDRHRILQIGLVVVESDHVVDQWSTYARLRWPWQRLGPRHIHGIRRRDLRGAPSLREALDELSVRLDGAIFTAHNAAFDGEFLVRAARAEGSTLSIGPRLCTLRMSRRLDPEHQLSHRLVDVCARHEVTNQRPHDALGDALATAAVLPHLLAAHGITSADQLDDFYDRPSVRGPSVAR